MEIESSGYLRWDNRGNIYNTIIRSVVVFLTELETIQKKAYSRREDIKCSFK
jgi:hypothetical protein